MSLFEIAARRIHYEVRGDAGPLMVLLNGMSQSTANWSTQARHLSARFRVLMYDARGQGRSDIGDPSGITLDAHVGDLAALLDELGEPSVALVGFSYGARIALAFAAAHPARVSSLALTSIGDDDDALGRTIVRSWREVLRLGGLEAMAWTAIPDILGRGFLRDNERFLAAMVKATLQRNTAEGLGVLLDAMERFPPALEDAARVECPVLLITASDDLLVGAESAAGLARALPHCEHRVLHGSGHTIPIESPTEWRAVVEAFLHR